MTYNASSSGLGTGQGSQVWQLITMGGRAVTLRLPSSFLPRLLSHQLLFSKPELSQAGLRRTLTDFTEAPAAGI